MTSTLDRPSQAPQRDREPLLTPFSKEDKDPQKRGTFFKRLAHVAFKTTGGRITTGVAGLGAGIGIVGGVIGGLNSSDRPAPVAPGGPVATGEAFPTNEPVEEQPVTGGEAAETIDAIKIEAGLSDEALAAKINQELSSWKTAGSEGFTDAWLAESRRLQSASTEAFETFTQQYAAEQTQKRVVALFGVESVDQIPDEGTRNFVAGMQRVLENYLLITLKTDGKFQPEYTILSSSAEQSGAGRTVTFNTELGGNWADSGANSLYIRDGVGKSPEGELATTTVTTRVEGGVEYISTATVVLTNP